MTTTKNKVIIIGGGAAGLMAGGRCAERGFDTTVIEHSAKTALKLGITGKGRCNLTNNCSPQEFINSVVHNPKFLLSAINHFSPSDCMEFFEKIGVPLKTERGNRVFPLSDKAPDVVYALRKYASGCKIVHGEAKKILTDGEKVTGVELARGEKLFAEKVIICTGGMSYPRTGSDGSGYRLVTELGHTLTELQPSLVPVVVKEDYCKALQGLSLKNISVKLYDDKKVIYEDFGEMLFTHFGVSGPVILSMSAFMKNEKEYRLSIGLKPALDDKTLNSRILSDFAKYANRDFENSLCDLLPQKLIPVIVKLSGIDNGKKVNSITKEERMKLFSLLRDFPLTCVGFRPIDEAIITRGGVSVKEINPGTMESKLFGGLFFAGEMIDVDAYTGGFNLQIAFSTARVAADSI